MSIYARDISMLVSPSLVDTITHPRFYQTMRIYTSNQVLNSSFTVNT